MILLLINSLISGYGPTGLMVRPARPVPRGSTVSLVVPKARVWKSSSGSKQGDLLLNSKQIHRKAKVSDFRPTTLYNKNRIAEALRNANVILSTLTSPDLGEHNVYLFNPLIMPKIQSKNSKVIKMGLPVYQLMARDGYGYVITINDTLTNKQFNF